MTENAPAVPGTIDPVEERMKADGVALTEEIYIDVWGYHDIQRWYFPGQERFPESQRLYLEVQTMTEGVRQRYQKATNAKVTILKKGGDAEMGVDPARDRYQLCKKSVVGWYMRRKGNDGTYYEVQYTDRGFDDWFHSANPQHIDKLEQFIRSINPFMLDEFSLDGVREEIERLQKVEEDLVRRKEEQETFPEAGSAVAER